jgi:hypothetical protein
MTSRLLHFIPSAALAVRWHGAAKDILPRAEWLSTAVKDYERIEIQNDFAWLGKPSLETSALVEYSSFPKLQASLQKAGVRTCVRAHNAEALQHIDTAGWSHPNGLLWVIRGAIRLLLKDRRSLKASDVFLPISSWEARNYWARLFVPGATIHSMPYFTPDHLLASTKPAMTRNLIVCLPNQTLHRKPLDLVTRFVEFAKRGAASGVEFAVTGDLDGWPIPEVSRIKKLGIIPDMRTVYPKMLAVAMLSPLGYGFKTTMMDAISNGVPVLAHPKLIQRCDPPLKDYLIPVDSQSPPPWESLLSKISTIQIPKDLNSTIRGKVRTLLSELLELR